MTRKNMKNLFEARNPKYKGYGSLEEKLEKILTGKVVLTESVSNITSKLFELPYAIIGGHAVTIHGHPRTTEDIDLLVRKDDVEAAMDMLDGQDPRPLTIGGASVTMLDGTEIDLVSPDQPWVDNAIKHAVDTKYGKVVSKPYLVLMKLWASRGGQEDMDIMYTLKGMNEDDRIETTELVKHYLPNDFEDFEQLLETSQYV